MIPFDNAQVLALSYAFVFGCVSLGLFSLRPMMKTEVGPGYWATGILANALGFVFWSGTVSVPLVGHLLVGEILHITGFFLLVVGAYRFTGNRFQRWNWIFLGAWAAVWVVAIVLLSRQKEVAMFLIKALRTVLFVSSGTLLLMEGTRERTIGIHVAGIGLVAWGGFILLSALVSISQSVYYGLLVGFQLVACLGMVAMVLDKMRLRAEKSEEQIRTLEGILPICSYCKKIRDENDAWHRLEAYIENRSAAEFTHGVCPDCFAKHKGP